MSATNLFIEIGQCSIKVLDGDDGLELPLERLENGPLTPLCRERLTLSLRAFLKKKSWRRRRALCAIGARGVSLRRLTLPPAGKDELQRLLRLQIEKEFPLAPEDLAWGYAPLSANSAARTSSNPPGELLVSAVKAEVLDEYSEILGACGLIPSFTLAALARSSICPQPPGSYGVIEIGRCSSELICFEQGIPSAIRIFSWGGDHLTRRIAEQLSISFEQAETLKLNFAADPSAQTTTGASIERIVRAELENLARAIKTAWTGQKLFLTGRTARLNGIDQWLSQSLGGIECVRMEVMPSLGRSAAILGLKTACEEGRGPLILLAKGAMPEANRTRPSQRQLAAAIVLCALAALAFRYAEPLLLKPRLVKKLSEYKTYRDKLPKIDRELSFLQFLEKNRMPYLDALVVLAGAAPPGLKIEALSLNRRGDLSVRAGMQNSQQAVDFRSKLIESGFFSSVVLEEQTPTPDRQRLAVRMVAQLKPPEARTSPKVDPVPDMKLPAMGMPPGMSMPMAMPVGMPMMPGGPMPGGPMPMGDIVPGGAPPPMEMPAGGPAVRVSRPPRIMPGGPPPNP